MRRRKFLAVGGGLAATIGNIVDEGGKVLKTGVNTVVGETNEQNTPALDPEADIVIERGHYQPYAGSKVAMRVLERDTEAEEYRWRITHEPSEGAGELLHDSGGHTTLTTREAGPYNVEVEAIFDDGSTMSARRWVNAEEMIIEELNEEVMDLAEQYAPILHFHPSENFFPTRYEAYIENSELIRPRRVLRDTIIENPSLLDLAGKEEKWINPGTFDIEELERFQDPHTYPETVYTSVHRNVTIDDEEYIAIGYWMFYVHDPKPSDVYGDLPDWLAAHTGDQEPVFILLNESGAQWVASQQHKGGELRPWDQVAKTDDHIHIYPAEGAHSNFLEPYAGDPDGETLDPPPDNYAGQHLFQEQYWPEEEISTDLHPRVYSVSWYADPIENETRWRPGEDGYDLILLTDEMVWEEYDGPVYTYRWKYDGEIPMQQPRWDDLSGWIVNNIAESHEQFDGVLYDPDETRLAEVIDEGRPIPNFEPERSHSNENITARLGIANIGPQPGLFVVSVTAEHETGREQTVEHSVYLDTGNVGIPDLGGVFGISEQRIIPDEWFDDPFQVPLFPSSAEEIEPGNWTVTIELASYTTDIRLDDDDIHDTLVFEFEHEADVAATISFDDVADGEVSPGDVVEATALVSREDRGDQEHTFFVGYGAVDFEGEPYDNDGTTGTTVTLEPGATAEVDLEWIVEENAPEGWYDLGTAVWLEADRDALQTRLDEAEREEAIEVIGTDVGYLYIESDPLNATVEINGDIEGDTPLTVKLEADTYDLVVDAPDHQPEELTATVTAGETAL